ncbi:MAG: alpha/beta hydrolase [Erysipelotrichaceae bacterium]|nr:alpha/beta hydrolase [Erysipelotrichaceae bacterium]
MKKEEFVFESHDGITNIRAVRYIPEETRCILQIAHGMVEFIDRYEGFAKFLCDRGFLVTGHDHLGHGGSVIDESKWGYFAKDDGNRCLIEDMHSLTLITKEMYPDIPYFLMGHSMGSFYTRQYLIDYSDELNGCIIMGTGSPGKIAATMGMNICKVMALFKGWEYRSDMVNNIVMGSYNAQFKPNRTSVDWLTKDEAVCDWYLSEPRCTFVFTLNAFCNMFKGISRLYDKELLKKMEKRLPVYFVSGDKDPVGNNGKGVKEAYDSFIEAGMIDAEMKLFENDRHEILNETDKEDVYEDIFNWISGKLRLR